MGAFACFALGLWLARDGAPLPSAGWFALAAAGAAAALLARGWACRAALAFAAVALGAAWMTARVHEPARDALERLVPPDAWLVSPVVRVRGVLEGDPQPAAFPRGELDLPLDDGPAWRFALRVHEAETPGGWAGASGSVRVRVAGVSAPWRAGDWVELTGTFEPLEPARNPGGFDALAAGRSTGQAGSVEVPDAALVTPGAPAGALARAGGWWYDLRGSVRRRALHAAGLDGAVSGASPGGALVGALVFGARDRALDPHADAFARVGVAHLLAISGFHLAVLAGLALLAVRATGDRGWVEPAVVIALVLLYALVLPARTPILRAAIMVVVLLSAEGAGRRYDRVCVLAWAGVALLVWRPLELWNLGFQLSMAVTFVLLTLGDRGRGGDDLRAALARRAAPGGLPRWVRGPARWLGGYAWACVACWLVASPVVIAHLHVFSPLAPLATMLSVPPVLATLMLGYLSAAAGLVVGPVPALAGLASGAGSLTVALVAWADGLALASVRTGPVSALWAGAAALGAWWAVCRARPSDWRPWVLLACLAGWGVAEMRLAAGPEPGVALRVDTLDVANGTCHLVRSGDEALLWDCGSLSPAIGARTVEPALRALGRRTVRTAVVTHANLDHYNALPEIAQAFGVERVLTTDAFVRAGEAAPGAPEGVALRGLRGLGVEIVTLRAGDSFTFGDARVEVLWPPADPPARGITRANDTSLVARFVVPTRAGERSVLLTGDIQTAGALGVLDALGDRPGADVLELPHHGSVSMEAAALVAAADPRVVLQSTGPGRAREPAWAGLRAGRAWWVTAEHGAAWAELRRDGSVASGAMLEGR